MHPRGAKPAVRASDTVLEAFCKKSRRTEISHTTPLHSYEKSLSLRHGLGHTGNRASAPAIRLVGPQG